MKKKLLWSIIIVSIAVVAFVIFNIKRDRMPLRVKGDKAPSSLSLSGMQKMAQAQEAKGDILEAKATYQRLINEFPNSRYIMDWQRRLEGLNIKLLFSSLPTPKSISYEIKPGDTLEKISRQFKTTVELIMKSNNLATDKIVPGRKIKCWRAPFSILVDKSQNILILKSDEEIIKTYIVSTGANNSTPVGNFKITNKLVNPTWFKAGAVVSPGSPENVLGSRWLGLDLSGYGIHGTTDPKSLGTQVTQGCVRLNNSDVEELYAIIPIDTEVTVID